MMEEVNVEAVESSDGDRCFEVVEGVQVRLEFPPVVLVSPILDDFFECQVPDLQVIPLDISHAIVKPGEFQLQLSLF